MPFAEKNQEIDCQQVLMADASVFSLQATSLPSPLADGAAPSALLEKYLLHIRRVTLSLVRPLRTEEGVEFRLLGSRLSLLSFHAPSFLDDGRRESAVLSIRGGILVHPRYRECGELLLARETGDGLTRITLQLSGFYPLLLGGAAPRRANKLLYRLTQAAIHKAVTVRFLMGLCRELSGGIKRFEVVKRRIMEGEDI